MPRYLLVLGLLAGCATPPALLQSHPEPPSPPEVASHVSLAPLAPAPQPTLPAALRLATSDAVDHGAMGHAEMDHAASAPEASGDTDRSATPPALAHALDAYLAIQSALALDQTEGISDHALAFTDAWSAASREAPGADPHFWHERNAEVLAVGTHARALADATSLDAAREAFGALSAPFAALVDAHGAPEGYNLSRFTCGMRSDLPEGGVWLQRGRETRNPYFGNRMLACGTRDAAVPSHSHDMRAGASPEALPIRASGETRRGADHETGDHD